MQQNISYDHSIGNIVQPLDLHALGATLYTGRLAMTLFFVLSGFVIHYNYGDSLSSVRSVRAFVVARFARLYPLYIFSLVLAVALMGAPIGKRLTLTPLLSYVTMTQDWWPILFDGSPIYPVYVGVAWSISAEVALYLFYVPVASLIGRLKLSGALCVLVLVLVVGTWIDWDQAQGVFGGASAQYNFFYLSPVARLPEFLLGAVTAQLVILRGTQAPGLAERTPLLLLALLSICIMYGGAIFGPDSQRSLFDALQYSWGFAPGCAGLMYYFSRNRSRASLVVEARPIVALGEASYSLYLLQGWVFALFASSGLSVSYFHAGFKILGAWAFLALLALGSYRYLEVPSRRFIRRILGPRAEQLSAPTLETDSAAAASPALRA